MINHNSAPAPQPQWDTPLEHGLLRLPQAHTTSEMEQTLDQAIDSVHLDPSTGKVVVLEPEQARWNSLKKSGASTHHPASRGHRDA